MNEKTREQNQPVSPTTAKPEQAREETTKMDREIKKVLAGNIHQSSVLPLREGDEELSNSIKQIGVQQPLIVRPFPGRPGEYEAVDGGRRRRSLNDNEQVLVDIRYNAKDSKVFEISNATFARKDRSAYEMALFYHAWSKALEKELGSSEGLQQKLAELASLSEPSLSQYLAIAELFQKLKELAPDEPFTKLKTWSINKLYKLSELTGDPRLLDLAHLFELKIETTIDEIIDTVNSYLGIDQEPHLPFDDEFDKPISDMPQTFNEQQSAVVSSESKRLFLKKARKVGSLADETHETLSAIVQELTQDADRLSSADILQTLTKVIHTLRKLKRHSNILKQRIKPNTAGGNA